MLSTFEISKTFIWLWLALIVFWSSTYQCCHLCPQKTVQKATTFPQWRSFSLKKPFYSYLLLGLSSFFGQNSQAFLKHCYFIVSFRNWLKYYVWLLWCKVCLPIFEKKPNFQNGQKSRENRTNMDIILSFLAKPVDKHGITLVHITYLPMPNLGVAAVFEV